MQRETSGRGLVKAPSRSVVRLIDEIIELMYGKEFVVREILFIIEVKNVIAFEPVNLRNVTEVSPRMVYGMGASWLLDGLWVRFQENDGYGVVRRVFEPTLQHSLEIVIDLGTMSNRDVFVLYQSLTSLEIPREEVRRALLPHLKVAAAKEG